MEIWGLLAVSNSRGPVPRKIVVPTRHRQAVLDCAWAVISTDKRVRATHSTELTKLRMFPQAQFDVPRCLPCAWSLWASTSMSTTLASSVPEDTPPDLQQLAGTRPVVARKTEQSVTKSTSTINNTPFVCSHPPSESRDRGLERNKLTTAGSAAPAADVVVLAQAKDEEAGSRPRGGGRVGGGVTLGAMSDQAWTGGGSNGGPKDTVLAKNTDRVLVVGRGVVLTANVTSCDKVIVEGMYTGNIQADTFVLSEGMSYDTREYNSGHHRTELQLYLSVRMSVQGVT